ncbi:MAG: His/Gly/Thr/Pro-type tRNA ligase C-terminal domain-containing protein, partial [Nitrososphaeraceae archaeon]
GVAGGVERILAALSHHRLLNVETKPLVFVVSENNKESVLKLISELRGAGIPADYDSRTRSLRKQLDYGFSIGATVLLKVEQKGIENIITVKNLVTGQETKGKVTQVLDLVSNILRSSN